MATGTKFDKPKTNVPRYGVLKAIYYVKGGPQYPDKCDIKVVGNWEPDKGFAGGEGFFYLPYPAAKAFTKAGVIKPNGIDTRAEYRGEPLFAVTQPGLRIMVLREEDGKAKLTTVSALDDDGNELELPAQADPPPPPAVKAEPAAEEGGEEPAPSKGKAKGRPAPGAAAKQPEASSSSAAPAPARPAAAATNGDKPRLWYLEQWGKIAEAHLAASRIALRSLLDVTGQTLEDFMALPLGEQLEALQVLSPQVSTLLIRAESMGLGAYVGMARDVDAIGEKNKEASRLLKSVLRGDVFVADPPQVQPKKPEPAPKPAAAAGKKGDTFADYPEALDGPDDDLPF